MYPNIVAMTTVLKDSSASTAAYSRNWPMKKKKPTATIRSKTMMTIIALGLDPPQFTPPSLPLAIPRLRLLTMMVISASVLMLVTFMLLGPTFQQERPSNGLTSGGSQMLQIDMCAARWRRKTKRPGKSQRRTTTTLFG